MDVIYHIDLCLMRARFFDWLVRERIQIRESSNHQSPKHEQSEMRSGMTGWFGNFTRPPLADD
jgi:phage antirepressor YoqD-like protein